MRSKQEVVISVLKRGYAVKLFNHDMRLVDNKLVIDYNDEYDFIQGDITANDFFAECEKLTDGEICLMCATAVVSKLNTKDRSNTGAV
jgi:hypothetical protein